MSVNLARKELMLKSKEMTAAEACERMDMLARDICA